jgi:hypothetical protein
MIVNDELQIMCKESFVAYFHAQSSLRIWLQLLRKSTETSISIRSEAFMLTVLARLTL